MNISIFEAFIILSLFIILADLCFLFFYFIYFFIITLGTAIALSSCGFHAMSLKAVHADYHDKKRKEK